MNGDFNMKITEKMFSGFRSYALDIGGLTIGVPLDIGPRILHLATVKRPDFNLFGILPEAEMPTADGVWKILGGHRLWSSPESKPRSYSLDNKPVKLETIGQSVTIRGNPEPENSVQKVITISPTQNGVLVNHTIRNIGRWPISLACWALSVMRRNGRALIPMRPSKMDEEGLLPDRHFTLWPYTNMADVRLTFKNDHLIMKQDPEAEAPLKIGAVANPEWVAYHADGLLFVKQFRQERGEYPDFGCSVEVYTNSVMLELETLGSLRTIAPSESLEHTEIWRIFEMGDADLESRIIEKIEALINR